MLNVRKRREEVGGGPALKREPRKVRDGSVAIHIGLRATSVVVGALAFGFTLGLVVTYGLADGRPRTVPSRLSVSKTTASTSFERPYGSQMPSSSGMRLASLEMPVSGFEADDIDPLALARAPGVFDRPQRLDSFDERFGASFVWSDTAPARAGEGKRTAHARPRRIPVK